MKILKTVGLILLLILTGLLPACQSTAPAKSDGQTDLSELTELPYLRMVMRYLYRWQLDQSQFETLVRKKNIVFWIRPVKLKLDPGDHSQFADILLPQMGLTLRVKKAHYRIAELNADVESKQFKIIRVTRGNISMLTPRRNMVVSVDSEEMRDFLFNTRNQRDTFDPAVVEKLLAAARDQAAKENLLDTNVYSGQQLIAIAPQSPAANETWVLWEMRRKLFYIASDMDLADPALWKYQTLTFRTFDLKEQVVIAREEATSGNFYMTRHQLSRVLFNCIVLGQRIDIPARAATNAAPAK